jgi:signal transduction histidine kinase
MSSSPGPSLLRTATFRLALTHAALFAILSLATFALVYVTLKANLGRRIDAELAEDVREMEGKLRGASAARKAAIFREDLDAADAAKEFRVLLVGRSRARVTSDLDAWHGVELTPGTVQALAAGQEAWRTVEVRRLESDARVLARRTSDGDLIEFGTSLADNQELLDVVRRIFVLGWIATIVPGFLLGWFMARRAMAGVDRVTATASRIGTGDLTQRVPVGHEGEEIENLARTFNAMLDRLHVLVRELKGVSSNIAHDLKSPIARIRATAESAVRSGVAASAPLDEQAAWLVIEECDRLAAMIDTILEIAATDARVAALTPSAVDLSRVVRDAVDLFHPVADDKRVRLELDLPQEPLVVPGDVSRVQRVVANLLDNAIKYTAAGGTVRVAARGTPLEVRLTVTDTGVGIPADDLPRVFEHFYRGDASRSTPGHGLGLSLAQSIVRAYGGEITAESRDGRGSAFTVRWPSPAAPRSPQT